MSKQSTTIRLNAVMRQSILDAAIAHAFEPRDRDLLKEELAISSAIWEIKWGGIKRSISKLTKEWYYCRLDETALGRAYFCIGGEHCYLRLDCVSLRWPTSMPRVNVETGDPASAAVVNRFREWQHAKETYHSDENKTRATLSAMLDGYKTLEALEKGWPEGKNFYKHVKANVLKPSTLPAVQIKALNKMLGLTS